MFAFAKWHFISPFCMYVPVFVVNPFKDRFVCFYDGMKKKGDDTEVRNEMELQSGR